MMSVTFNIDRPLRIGIPSNAFLYFRVIPFLIILLNLAYFSRQSFHQLVLQSFVLQDSLQHLFSPAGNDRLSSRYLNCFYDPCWKFPRKKGCDWSVVVALCLVLSFYEVKTFVCHLIEVVPSCNHILKIFAVTLLIMSTMCFPFVQIDWPSWRSVDGK